MKVNCNESSKINAYHLLTSGTSTSRRENLNVHPTDQVDNSHAENCTNENNENENISKTEIKPSVVVGNGDSQPEQQANLDNRDDEFRIKLKYLNDELRLVKGTPNEAIGDFKKYFGIHFS